MVFYDAETRIQVNQAIVRETVVDHGKMRVYWWLGAGFRSPISFVIPTTMHSEATSLPPDGWPEPSRVAAHDMRDTEEELQRYPRLAPLLEDCVPLGEHHATWDALAKKQFGWHSFLMICTAVLATLAVLLAIAQLPGSDLHGANNDSPASKTDGPPADKDSSSNENKSDKGHEGSNHSKILEYAEVLCAAFAFFAVVFGTKVTFDHRWRQHRFQAEHVRLIKFGYLLNAAKRKRNREEGRAFLNAKLSLLRKLDKHAPEEWVLYHRDDLDLPELESPEIDETTLKELVDYFRTKRIGYQGTYFRKEGARRKFREKWSAAIPLYLFFLSLLAAVGHFIVGHFVHDAKELAFWLLVAAATLPVIAAGVRTVRGAMEYGRNANRYESLYNRLWKIENQLKTKTDKGDVTGQMYALRDIEQALESEHRSWQRLMIEAEWFG